jgi:hypothetical protein
LQNKEHQYDEKQKQEVRDKESNTLEKFGEHLKPQTLDHRALFREGEDYSSQQSKRAVKKF